MKFRKRGLRAMVLGLLAVAGLALAPAAFAGGHIGIGVNVPGVSLGYWGGHRGHGFVDIGVGGYYGPAYYGGYYAPASVYYDGYYPAYPAYGAYYSRPYYGHYPSRYYYRGGSRGGYGHGGYSNGNYGHDGYHHH
jgi:hypothetical protein